MITEELDGIMDEDSEIIVEICCMLVALLLDMK